MTMTEKQKREEVGFEYLTNNMSSCVSIMGQMLQDEIITGDLATVATRIFYTMIGLRSDFSGTLRQIREEKEVDTDFWKMLAEF